MPAEEEEQAEETFDLITNVKLSDNPKANHWYEISKNAEHWDSPTLSNDTTPHDDKNYYRKRGEIIMSKLEWDKTGERFLEYGTQKGVLYVQNADGTYGTGVVWNGLTAVTESPDGAEPNDLYADDMKYASLRSAETFGGTIEAYQSPDAFDECDGTAVPVTGVYLGQQKRKPFGFSFVTQVGNDTATDTDDGYKLHIWYNCTASPSERSYETVNDSPDAITFSWEIATTPVPLSGYKPISTITIDSTKLDTTGKTRLALLEDKLYGTNSTQPQLPDPATVIGIMSGTITE